MEDIHPLSLNFKKFQRYNFEVLSIEDVIFFEYILICFVSFGYKEFYKSDIQILKDTNIKRTRLRGAKQKFESMGILSITVKKIKGNPPIQYYIFNPKILLIKLENIYLKEYCESMMIYFFSFLNNNLVYDLTEDDQAYINSLIFEMENIYRSVYQLRGIKLLNDKLTCNNYGYKGLIKLINEIGYQELLKSFENLIHNIINGNAKPKNVLNYFITSGKHYTTKYVKRYS